MFATTPNIIQLFRTDFFRQIAPSGTQSWNYGDGKGFDFIPLPRTEVDILIPGYTQHHSTGDKDGFDDLSFLAKVRLASGNEAHHSYVISAALSSTIPTGSYKNGSTAATVLPTLLAGKGFGKLNVQSTLGATLPLGNTAALGRPIAWSTTLQYHLTRLLWPEIENNATYYHGGANGGRIQNFISPGLVVSKIKLRKDPDDRLAILFGGGMQIATSEFHTYNHGFNLSTRIIF